MRFGVLGRLEVRRSDGTPVTIAGPARRQVLAALLSRAGSLVSAAALIDDLWGDAAPRSAVGSLRSHVARLRDDLGREEAGALLATEGDGYRLAIGTDDLDASIFERLTAQAAQLSDPRAAVRCYDAALQVWRDDAYLDFGEAPFAVAARVRLAELRAFARERRTDLALDLGMAGELVGELEQRVRAEPYRERGWQQLALALYRDGRQADALTACRRARVVLVDDLGVDPGPELREVESRILRHDPQLVAVPQRQPAPVTVVADRCPYLGLGGYEEADAALFVGRERLTSILAGRLSDQSVVVVTGASGVGKSSLIRAGLIPALRAGALPGSASWRVGVQTPAAIVASDGAPARSLDLLVVDQAEEMFTSLDAADRNELVARLARHIDQQDGRLLLVLRSDFYGRLADVESLAPLANKTTVVVAPMRADELRRALIEPAAAAGLRLEDELVETILDDVAGQPEPLPLLSEAMVRTWQRRQGDLLTLDGYRLAGEVAGALEAAAEECFTRLDAAQRAAARHLLVRMAARTATGWIRRPVSRPDSDDPADQAALDALIAARLVVADEGRVEITHDALLAHWPRLRDWLEERRLAADLLQHLDQATTAWRVAGRQPADLYRGPRLTAAADWRAEHPEDLSPAEHEFLDASTRAAQTELEAARAQIAREARGRRNLRRIAIALAAVVVLALAGGAVALYERGTARTQTSRARQAALTADARRLAALSGNAPDIATSSLLAVAAYRLQDSADTRGALLDAVERNQSALWRIQISHRPQRVAATPDGSRVAVNDNRNQVTVFDPRTRKQVASFPTVGFLYGITASGRQVVDFGATNSADPVGRLAAYDVPSGRQHVITDAGDLDTEPAMSGDGRWLAVTTTRHLGKGAIVDVFDSRNWSARPLHFASAGPVASLTVGRSVVAAEDADGAVQVRSLPTMRVVGRLPAAPGGAVGLAASPDGSYLARVDPGQPSRALIYALRGHYAAGAQIPVQAGGTVVMQFAPDGSQLAVAPGNGSLATYRVPVGAQLAALPGHAGQINGIAWTGVSAPTGLYTVGLDGQLVSWDLSGTPRTVRETGASLPFTTRAERFGEFVVGDLQPPDAPNSRRLIYAIDVRTGAYASWPAGLHDDEGIGQVVSSLNGERLLVSITGISGTDAGRNRIEIFDLRTHRDVGRLALPPGTSFFIDGLNGAISPDARFAYASLGRTRVGVFALPSGRYLRSYSVRFADPDSGRIAVIPWQFDPAGRLIVGGFDPGPDGGEPWSKNGPRLAPDQRLGLLEPASGRMLAQTRLGDISYPTALGWSPDKKLLAVGTYDGTLALYDAATFRTEANAGVADGDAIRTVAFAADGRTVVSGGDQVKFWSVPTLSPEGQGVVVASNSDRNVWAWYAPNGDVVGLAADSRKPVAGLQRWFDLRAAPHQLIAVACQLAGADITRAQWQRYVGDRPYRHVCD